MHSQHVTGSVGGTSGNSFFVDADWGSILFRHSAAHSTCITGEHFQILYDFLNPAAVRSATAADSYHFHTVSVSTILNTQNFAAQCTLTTRVLELLHGFLFQRIPRHQKIYQISDAGGTTFGSDWIEMESLFSSTKKKLVDRQRNADVYTISNGRI